MSEVSCPPPLPRGGHRLRLTPVALAMGLGTLLPMVAQAACPAGYYTPDGGANCYPSPAGTYSPIGATAPTPVPAGYWSSTVGASSSSVATPAAVGTYISVTGATSSSAAQPAPVGYYVPSPGASAATQAHVGYFVSATGQSSESKAPAGYYVPTPGASAATAAQPGYYVPNAGSSTQFAAPVGSYVPTSAAVMAPTCPSGTGTSQTGSNACRITSSSYAGGPPGVGPVFSSNYGSGGVVHLGTVSAGSALAFSILNSSADLAANLQSLVGLTLASATLGGTDAGLFSLNGFLDGTVLDPGGAGLNFDIDIGAGTGGSNFAFTLSFATDQFALFGGSGQNFVYQFDGLFADSGGGGVPEPGSAGLSLAALVALGLVSGGLRRRRTAAAPPENERSAPA